MPSLLERNRLILSRIDAPGPIADRIRGVFVAGKAAHLMAGVDADGTPFAPLAASTMRHHEGSPTPLVPEGHASRLILGYAVAVTPHPGRIEVSAGWPGLDWVRWLRTGTRRMPRRDPGGFRVEDKAEAIRMWKEEISRG